MAHLLNLKNQYRVFFLWTQYGTSSQSKFCTIHLLTLLILYRGVCSTLVESYPSRVWGFSMGGGAYLGESCSRGSQRCGRSRRRLSTLFLWWSPIHPESGAYLGVPVRAPYAGVQPQQVQGSPKVWTESAKKE